ncbi:hypothetical protein VP01_316g1 [Puccinia sorghi]|uniref:Uncharacterized protein n=1 Tax=Puccinia sorghi TaxID=27349 RepID=A0A0L6UYM8_9BASI|nr:hypothetical protein VP01_316g1 [Puccinia sorghi]
MHSKKHKYQRRTAQRVSYPWASQHFWSGSILTASVASINKTLCMCSLCCSSMEAMLLGLLAEKKLRYRFPEIFSLYATNLGGFEDSVCVNYQGKELASVTRSEKLFTTFIREGNLSHRGCVTTSLSGFQLHLKPCGINYRSIQGIQESGLWWRLISICTELLLRTFVDGVNTGEQSLNQGFKYLQFKLRRAHVMFLHFNQSLNMSKDQRSLIAVFHSVKVSKGLFYALPGAMNNNKHYHRIGKYFYDIQQDKAMKNYGEGILTTWGILTTLTVSVFSGIISHLKLHQFGGKQNCYTKGYWLCSIVHCKQKLAQLPAMFWHRHCEVCTVTVHQSLVESLVENVWSNKRSFLRSGSLLPEPLKSATRILTHILKYTQPQVQHMKISKIHTTTTPEYTATSMKLFVIFHFFSIRHCPPFFMLISGENSQHLVLSAIFHFFPRTSQEVFIRFTLRKRINHTDIFPKEMGTHVHIKFN